MPLIKSGSLFPSLRKLLNDQKPRESLQMLLSRIFKSELETMVLYSAVLLALVFTDCYPAKCKTKPNKNFRYYIYINAARLVSVQITMNCKQFQTINKIVFNLI